MPVWNETDYGALIQDVFAPQAKMYPFYIANISFEDDRVQLISEKLFNQFLEYEK